MGTRARCANWEKSTNPYSEEPACSCDQDDLLHHVSLAVLARVAYARPCVNRIPGKDASIYVGCGDRMAESCQPLCHGRDPVDENSVTVQSGTGRGPDGLLSRVLRSVDPTGRAFEVSVFATYDRSR